MAYYYRNPASSLFSEMFSGPNRYINIITAVSIFNALVIFGVLYFLEQENSGLEFFVTFRTLGLALLAYKFRTGLKRDFGIFICIVNIIIALIANYLTYNGDINDSGWEVMDSMIIEKASEKVSDAIDEDTPSSQNTRKQQPIVVQPQQPQQQPSQQAAPATNQYPDALPSLKKIQAQQPQPLRQGYSIGD